MITTMNEFTLCPHCGSTEYLENYPAPGISACTKCGHEVTKIPLKEMSEEEILKQNCPFCGKEGEEDDTLFDDYNIMVFKCKGCGKLDGYWVALQPSRTADGKPMIKIYYPKAVSLDKIEGNSPVYSAERAKEIAKAIRKKENDPKEKSKKQFNMLIREKRQELKEIGIDSESIQSAIWEVTFFISKGSTT